MFRTIHDCRLELVANTILADKWFNDYSGELVYCDDCDADYLPVSAARASFGKEDCTGEDEAKDRKLMKFLADNRHVSVFEHNYATFLVECPLFVRSQIMRHTSFRFNEVSRRYTSENIEFWIPDKAHAEASSMELLWRKQSKSNKQGSTDDLFCIIHQDEDWDWDYEEEMESAYSHYCSLVYQGVAREQARAVLPQSLLTRFYMTGNLRSWWSFLTSRLKEDTQYETRVVAQRIEKQLRELWPVSMSALIGEEQ